MRKNPYLTLVIFLIGIAVFPQSVEIELFKDGFSSPLNLQHAQDARLFVVEQGGMIKIIQSDGSVNPVPFLDISSQVSSGGERGLLGLAFHPNYANNGYFYINYTKTNGDTRVSRFSVDSGNPDVADPSSEFIVIEYSQPFSNHNGGCLAFGSDGYLYISSGDGGGSGDPNNRAQDKNTLLGKMLRLDVDNPSGGNNYGIPPDNPFVGDPNARGEIWAYGLRNPWKFSFDHTDNNLWIADVGQASLEEINRAAVSEAGLNYGWRCYEASQPFNTQGCPPQSEMTFPLAEYSHNGGNCSITGGYVYRGNVYSDIAGLYFFADFCSGIIGTVDNSGNLVDYGSFPGNWASFGEDVNKELYILDLNGGRIYKIKGGEIAGTDDNPLANTLSMVPNPASDSVSFTLRNDSIENLELFDVRGSKILMDTGFLKNNSEGNVDGKRTISIAHLRSGLYFVKITGGNGKSILKKLIIQ